MSKKKSKLRVRAIREPSHPARADTRDRQAMRMADARSPGSPEERQGNGPHRSWAELPRGVDHDLS